MSNEQLTRPTLGQCSEMVEEFHRKFGFAICLSDGLIETREQLDYDKDSLTNKMARQEAISEWNKIGLARAHLMQEELGELIAAWHDRKLVPLADAIGDLLYVVLGTAVAAGIPLEDVFDQIHKSNMTKEKAPYELHPKKGPQFKAPDLFPFLKKISCDHDGRL